MSSIEQGNIDAVSKDAARLARRVDAIEAILAKREPDRDASGVDAMKLDAWPLVDAYITETSLPDCQPDMRFRARLPCDGGDRYFATREEARKAIANCPDFVARNRIPHDRKA